jgi:uncharacterized protein (TIGR03790 family)
VVLMRSVLLLVLSLQVVPLVQAELLPNQVVIVANRNSRDSLQVAEHYAVRRGIPPQQIVRLDLPESDTISRIDYDRKLVGPLRQVLQQQNVHKRVRVLVTVYGVPLHVGPPDFTPAERALRRDAAGKLDAASTRLVEIERRVRTMGSLHSDADSKLEMNQDKNIPAYERNMAFFVQVSRTMRRALEQAQQESTMDRERYAPLESVFRAYQGLAGVQELHHEVSEPSSASNREQEAQRAQQLEGLQLLVGALELPVRQNRAELYQQVELVYGQYGVFALAAMESAVLSDESGDASVDSELSLLWWDRGDYPVTWRHPNPFYHAGTASTDRSLRELPVLLVSRLDAPTAGLAAQLVDRAIEAEANGLVGTMYLDAQGIPAKDHPDTYTKYDQSLLHLHKFVEQRSSYRSILENTLARFDRPGQAPDVALYIGWYRLRHYEDAFAFQPGAIGYHMASAEAVSLHRSGEAGWCKNALERGITATLGSVGEPYLDAFPEPLEFTALLMTGQYSLVETYYLTTRWVSWRMVLVGDPLYNPWKQKPAVKRSALSMFTLAPVAPSDQTFVDPLRTQEERRRSYARARERLNEILRSHESSAR